jgi:hypothetical protein
VNEIGNYHCVCPHGYMLLPNGSKYKSMFTFQAILVTVDMLSEMGRIFVGRLETTRKT